MSHEYTLPVNIGNPEEYTVKVRVFYLFSHLEGFRLSYPRIDWIRISSSISSGYTRWSSKKKAWYFSSKRAAWLVSSGFNKSPKFLIYSRFQLKLGFKKLLNISERQSNRINLWLNFFRSWRNPVRSSQRVRRQWNPTSTPHPPVGKIVQVLDHFSSVSNTKKY